MYTLRAAFLLPLVHACAPATPQVGPNNDPNQQSAIFEFAPQATCIDDDCNGIVLVANPLHDGPIKWAFEGSGQIREGAIQQYSLPPGDTQWNVLVWNDNNNEGVFMSGVVVRPTPVTDGGTNGDTGGVDTGWTQDDTGGGGGSIPSHSLVGETRGVNINPNGISMPPANVITKAYLIGLFNSIYKTAVINNVNGYLVGFTDNSCRYNLSLGGSTPGIGGCIYGQSDVRVSCNAETNDYKFQTFEMKLKRWLPGGGTVLDPSVTEIGLASAVRWKIGSSERTIGDWTQYGSAVGDFSLMNQEKVELIFDADPTFAGAVKGSAHSSHRGSPLDAWTDSPIDVRFSCDSRLVNLKTLRLSPPSN